MQPATPTDTVAPLTQNLPVIINRGPVPPVLYANAVAVLATGNEVFLTWGCATPPGPLEGDVTQMESISADYVARIAIPFGMVEQLADNFNGLRTAVRAIQEAARPQTQEGQTNVT